jgi:hypothetical protein
MRAASIGALQLVILSRAAKPGAKDLNQARSAYLLSPRHQTVVHQLVILNKRPLLPRVKDLKPGASSRPIQKLPSCKATDINR